jgi:protein TonB
MYYQETAQLRNDRMGFAVFLAAALHLILILGLVFEAGPPRSYSKQLKVTLATQPSTAAPEEAQHIAQIDQIGSGEEAELHQLTNPLPSPVPAQQTAEPREQKLSEASPKQREVPVVSTTAMARDQVSKKLEEQEAQAASLTGISPEVDRLAQELASLEATLDHQSKAYADRPRVRRLNAVSAKRAVDAAYLHDWRARLEAVGNKYYPKASLRYGIYGELRLLVVIRQDGSLEDIQVLSSSGYAVLDEAAIKIVRLAAPFAPFPAELRATTDKLEIIRTWQFQENRLSSG